MAEFLLSSNPKTISPEVYRGMFRDFIMEYAMDSIKSILLKKAGPEEHFGVLISALDLINFDPALAFTTLHFPNLLLPIFDDAIYETQSILLSHHSLFPDIITIKPHCHTRLVNLPPTPEFSKNSIRQIHSYEIDKLIQITGIITRTSSVRMLKVSKEYECLNPKCNYRFRVYADAERGHALPQPRHCPASQQQEQQQSNNEGEKRYVCNGTNLREIEGSAQCIDYQEIKIQDQMERLPAGYAPLSLLVSLEADMVDKVRVGEEVRVVGTIIRRWGSLNERVRCPVHVYLAANSIVPHHSSLQSSSSTDRQDHYLSLFETYWKQYTFNSPISLPDSLSNSLLIASEEEQRSLKARDSIVKAVCPNLHGMFYVKLSLLLTLIGGGKTQNEHSGNRRRSQSHLLLVGDPGTGKSQLLRFASTLLPCSVLTTGVGTTGSGLTCSAVRESNSGMNGTGGWAIEAGALVLANNGVCCIDEFSSIKEADRATIHEAMEQQTLSIAKAGMVVTLYTRCSVIAVCNPKGGYDVSSDITTNTAIAAPLLSRFDLVLVLMDRPNKEWDKRISTYLLRQAIREKKKTEPKVSTKTFKLQDGCDITWNKENLRKYVLLIRNSVQPKMTEPARCILVRYYQLQRLRDDRSSSRTTVRLFESSLRLAEAHAKLMFRDKVLIQDAIVAISCMELSSFDGGQVSSSSQSALHSDFPDNPDEHYTQLEERILKSMQFSRALVFREVLSRKRPIDTVDNLESLDEFSDQIFPENIPNYPLTTTTTTTSSATSSSLSSAHMSLSSLSASLSTPVPPNNYPITTSPQIIEPLPQINQPLQIYNMSTPSSIPSPMPPPPVHPPFLPPNNSQSSNSSITNSTYKPTTNVTLVSSNTYKSNQVPTKTNTITPMAPPLSQPQYSQQRSQYQPSQHHRQPLSQQQQQPVKSQSQSHSIQSTIFESSVSNIQGFNVDLNLEDDFDEFNDILGNTLDHNNFEVKISQSNGQSHPPHNNNNQQQQHQHQQQSQSNIYSQPAIYNPSQSQSKFQSQNQQPPSVHPSISQLSQSLQPPHFSQLPRSSSPLQLPSQHQLQHQLQNQNQPQLKEMDCHLSLNNLPHDDLKVDKQNEIENSIEQVQPLKRLKYIQEEDDLSEFYSPMNQYSQNSRTLRAPNLKLSQTPKGIDENLFCKTLDVLKSSVDTSGINSSVLSLLEDDTDTW